MLKHNNTRHIKRVPKDDLYRDLINKMLDQKITPENRNILRQKASEQLAKFNELEISESLFSLSALSPDKRLEDKNYTPQQPGSRTCYLKGGKPAAVLLNVEKLRFNLTYFQALGYRLDIKFSVISSFRNPEKFLGVLFKRREDVKSVSSTQDHKENIDVVPSKRRSGNVQRLFMLMGYIS